MKIDFQLEIIQKLYYSTCKMASEGSFGERCRKRECTWPNIPVSWF